MHHLKTCKAYALIYLRKCDIIYLTDKEKGKGETVMDWSRIEKEMYELEAKLGYTFKDISLLAEAMKSQKLEKIPVDGDNHDEYSNESMAFFGDTIIKYLLAKYLYGDGKNKRKGAMTAEKSKLEKNKTMHNIMLEEGLILYSYHDKYFSKDNPPQNEKVLTKEHDPYIEAIAAAIYKDGGWDAVTIWFENWLLPLLKKYKDFLPQQIPKDPVCELNEWCQKQKGIHETDYSKQGPDDKPSWTCDLTCYFNCQKWTSIGEGTTKAKAKEAAARKMLEQLKNLSE